ncbi:hypothetical protein F5Y16DRAFT_321792 [Xylariaceae sp. FL0255]|nr:hypothetical protein F5Y16DRAFT_321792 [Xylariaceae sp. FL0255]
MHLKSSASILPTALITLLLLVPSSSLQVSAASSRLICVRENAALLAQAANCGNPKALRDCFQNVIDYVDVSDLERCFVDVGCKISESVEEALHVVKNCDESSSAAELRRRVPEVMPGPTPAPAHRRDAAASSTPTPTASTSGRPSVCSTDYAFATSVCPVTSIGPNQFSNLPCTTTTLTSSRCAATNYCFDDGACIFRDDNLTTSGLIVSIALGLIGAICLVAFLFLYISDKRGQRRVREAAEQKLAAEKLKQEEAMRRRRQDEVTENVNQTTPFLPS